MTVSNGIKETRTTPDPSTLTTEQLERGLRSLRDIFDAENKRQDELRIANEKLVDVKIHCAEEEVILRAENAKVIREAESRRIDEQAVLREMYREKIAHAESGRLDSIRQVDREEVAKTAVAANTAIQTLAKQTTDLATTLQKTVQDTAQAAETRNSTQYTDVNKRLSALELSSSEGKGKQGVVDPQMDRLTALVEAMARSQASGVGKSEGVSATVAAFIAAGMMAVGLIGTLGYTISSKSMSPQVIYAPAPAVAQPTR